MHVEDNKSVVMRYAQEVLIAGNLALVEDFISPDYVRHDPGIPMEIRGPQGVKQLATAFRAAFPDFHLTTEIILAEGDKVAVLWRASGTNQGELMGRPATGKSTNFTAVDIFRLVDGKIAEQWVVSDRLSMLQQLGLVPTLN